MLAGAAGFRVGFGGGVLVGRQLIVASSRVLSDGGAFDLANSMEASGGLFDSCLTLITVVDM